MQGSDLRAFLLNQSLFAGSSGTGRIQVNVNDQEAATPRVYIQQSSYTDDDMLYSGADGMPNTSFDVEVIDEDITDCLSISQTIRKALKGYHGAFGSTWALGVFVEDHDDNYIPKGIDTDENFNVSALSVTIMS